MADPALLAEAYKRGLLPDDKKALYEEAQRRGVVSGGDFHQVASSHNGGVTVEVGGPAAASPPSVLEEAGKGFAQPFVTLGHDVAESYLRKPGEANLMDAPRIAGDVLGLASAPAQAVLRPIAAMAGRVLPTPYQGPQVSVDRSGVHLSRPQAMDRTEAALGVINTALQGARPAGLSLPAARAASMAEGPVAGRGLTQQVRAVTPQMPMRRAAVPPAPSLAELKTAKTAAYKKAEASGAVIDPTDATALAANVRKIVEDKGGAELYPTASAMAGRLEKLSGKGLTPTQLDDFRGQVYEQLMKDGGKEYGIGKDIRGTIDTVLDAEPAWADARALNTRYEKVREVSDRLGSAELQADATYSGGNLNNAIRQKLKPLIDPKSPQRLQNLTDDERAALSRAVRGTPGQNATRYAGKFLKNRFIQGATLAPTIGIGPVAMDLAGTVITKAGEAQTRGNVERLIELMARGGQPPATTVPLPAVTPRGLIGGSVLLAPAAPRPAQTKKPRK